MAIYGKVYDVSEFSTHPGGYEILVDNSGKDATKPFDDIDHSPSAKKDLEKYYIGDYVPGEIVPVQSSSFNYLLLVPFLFIIIGYIINSVLS